MKNFQKTIKFFLICALVLCCVLSFNSKVFAETQDVYDTSASTKKGDVVYWKKPANWSDEDVKIYAWNWKNSNDIIASFPGVSMTHVNGNLYKYEFTSDSAYDRLIFSSGKKGIDLKQTNDLDFICSGYIYDGECKTLEEKLKFQMIPVKNGDTIYFEKPSSWENVYIWLWNKSTNKNNTKENDWNHKPAMENVSENTYKYTVSNADEEGFDHVIFATSLGQQTIDLSTLGSNLTFKANEGAENGGENSGKWNGVWMYEFDKSSLQTLVSQTTVPAEDEMYYTEDSWEMYEEQFGLAKKLLDIRCVAASYSDFTSQYQKSLIALQFAYDHLKLNPKVLEDKINEMKEVETDIYTEESVNNFNDSIKESEEALKDELKDPDNIPVEKREELIKKMKDLINDMEVAKNNLELDKSELEATIKKAEDVDKNKYTDESVKALEEAKEEAQKVYDDSNATYDNVQAQIKSLNDAINNLKEKPTSVNDSQNSNENGNNTQNVGGNGTQNAGGSGNASGTPVQGIINTLNPFTGDTIFVYISIVIVAVITFAVTRKYLKKQKSNEKK